MKFDVAALVTAAAGIVGTLWAIYRSIRTAEQLQDSQGSPPAWLHAQTEFYERLVETQRVEIERLNARIAALEAKVSSLENGH